MRDSPCPCGSGRTLHGCCGPLIQGAAAAPTAEALMRSRYTAHVSRAADYLNRTQQGASLSYFSADEMERSARRMRWTGLKVVSTSAGGLRDEEGAVEFIASYEQDGQPGSHHELSTFRRIGGRWRYTEGRVIQDPTRRETPRVGRNQPCPCGSGRKYKRCCGRR